MGFKTKQSFLFRFTKVNLLDNSRDNSRCLHSCILGIINNRTVGSYNTLESIDSFLFYERKMTWFLGAVTYLESNSFAVSALIPSPYPWREVKKHGIKIFGEETKKIIYKMYGESSVEGILEKFKHSSDKLEIDHRQLSISAIIRAMGNIDNDYCIVGLDANKLYKSDTSLKSGHYVSVVEFSDKGVSYLDPNFIDKGVITVTLELFIMSMNSINLQGGELLLISMGRT